MTLALPAPFLLQKKDSGIDVFDLDLEKLANPVVEEKVGYYYISMSRN